MDPEDESLQLQLLRSSDRVASGNQVVYKLLASCLRARDLRGFRSLLDEGLRRRVAPIDVNHAFPDRSEETLLDMACADGATEFVEVLTERGAEVNRVNASHLRAPLHFAADGGHASALRALLRSPRTNPNLEAGQQTALHLAVRRGDLECVAILLEAGASPNLPNSKGLTALHLAAMRSNREIIELMRRASRHALELDRFRDYNGDTTRDVLRKKIPGIELPPPIDRTVNLHDLRYYLNANDETNFLRAVKDPGLELKGDAVEDLMEIAARRNFRKALLELLERIPNAASYNLVRAATEAIRHGHHEILRELLKINGEMANDLIIDACVELGRPEKRGSSLASDKLECLRLILEEDNVNVRCADGKGCTPLHYAARAGNRPAMKLLLEKGSYVGHANNFGVPALADIPAETLGEYLDECLHARQERTNEYVIEFDYRCLRPQDDSSSSSASRCRSETETLLYVAGNNGLKHLLKHPLLSSFLYLKWHRVRHLLYANFLFYVVFYLLLNLYVLRANATTAGFDGKTAGPGTNNSLAENVEVASVRRNGLWAATCVALILLVLRESLQFLSSPFHYARSVENWLEVALVVLTAALLNGAGQQVGAIAILLSAWELVVLIGQHPRMSTGIEMFKTVSLNFIRFLFLYAFLILAFALAFFTLFKDGGDENFPDPGHALFKTIIMLTGEFDANDIPFVSHPVLSRLVFALFVFLIAIVLFNLLNGLAVSDTADILGKAELVALVSRTRLVAYIENVALGAPGFLRRRRCSCLGSLGRKFNPLSLLARRVLLFPDYLKNTKILVVPYDDLEVYSPLKCCARCRDGETARKSSLNYPVLKMEPRIVRRAKDLLSRRGQLSDTERINAELERVNEHLAIIEETLESLRRAVGNNNVNTTEDEN